jgi:hypothetical protein
MHFLSKQEAILILIKPKLCQDARNLALGQKWLLSSQKVTAFFPYKKWKNCSYPWKITKVTKVTHFKKFCVYCYFNISTQIENFLVLFCSCVAKFKSYRIHFSSVLSVISFKRSIKLWYRIDSWSFNTEISVQSVKMKLVFSYLVTALTLVSIYLSIEFSFIICSKHLKLLKIWKLCWSMKTSHQVSN